MADDTKAATEEEPSIEEILDSIRQIIADDDEDENDASVSNEDAVVTEVAEEVSEPNEPLDQSAIDDLDFDAPAAEPEEPEEPETEEESEPLDQSAIDDIDFSAVEPAVEPEEKIIELTERVADDVDLIDEKPEAAAPEPEPENEPVDIADDTLLTKGAEEAAFSAISELARKTAIEYNGITLEDIVRSEIKPMLSTWLDKNLPVIIERLVKEELERVSKRVLED